MIDTRRHIIETAFVLFLRKGFKAVRLTDIERAAKITRGTFYYHFTSKEELLREGVSLYYQIINKKREEEFARLETLREYIDLAISRLNFCGRTVRKVLVMIFLKFCVLLLW